MTEPTIRNKAHQRAKDDGWVFADFLTSGPAWVPGGRLYRKETPYGPLYLKIPEGNTGIRLYHYGSLGVEFFIIRRRWLREAHIWERQLMELIMLDHRVQIKTKEIIRKEKK